MKRSLIVPKQFLIWIPSWTLNPNWKKNLCKKTESSDVPIGLFTGKKYFGHIVENIMENCSTSFEWFLKTCLSARSILVNFSPKKNLPSNGSNLKTLVPLFLKQQGGILNKYIIIALCVCVTIFHTQSSKKFFGVWGERFK